MKFGTSVWRPQPNVSLVFGGPFHRYERQLLQVREVTFRVGRTVRRWKLFDHRLGGEESLEVFRIDLVEGLTIGEAVEINSCGDHLAEIHGRQVVSTTVYLDSLSDSEAFNKVYAELCCCCSAINA